MLRLQPSVETILPVVMEASLQPSIFQQNYLGHQQLAFSSDFSLMLGDKSRFSFDAVRTGPAADSVETTVASLFSAGVWK